MGFAIFVMALAAIALSGTWRIRQAFGTEHTAMLDILAASGETLFDLGQDFFT